MILLVIIEDFPNIKSAAGWCRDFLTPSDHFMFLFFIIVHLYSSMIWKHWCLRYLWESSLGCGLFTPFLLAAGTSASLDMSPSPSPASTTQQDNRTGGRHQFVNSYTTQNLQQGRWGANIHYNLYVCMSSLLLLDFDWIQHTASHHLQTGLPRVVLPGRGSEVVGGEGKLRPLCHRRLTGQTWCVTPGGKLTNISFKSSEFTLIWLITELAVLFF